MMWLLKAGMECCRSGRLLERRFRGLEPASNGLRITSPAQEAGGFDRLCFVGLVLQLS